MKGICPEFDSSEKNKRCPHSGVGTLPVHSSNTNRVANCLDFECACQSSAAWAQTMRDNCNYVSTHSNVACTRTYCESGSGVKLATCWLRKRKGKTG